MLLEKNLWNPSKKSLKPSQNDHCLCGKKPLRKYIDHHVFLNVYHGRRSEIDYHRAPLSTRSNIKTNTPTGTLGIDHTRSTIGSKLDLESPKFPTHCGLCATLSDHASCDENSETFWTFVKTNKNALFMTHTLSNMENKVLKLENQYRLSINKQYFQTYHTISPLKRHGSCSFSSLAWLPKSETLLPLCTYVYGEICLITQNPEGMFLNHFFCKKTITKR